MQGHRALYLPSYHWVQGHLNLHFFDEFKAEIDYLNELIDVKKDELSETFLVSSLLLDGMLRSDYFIEFISTEISKLWCVLDLWKNDPVPN